MFRAARMPFILGMIVLVALGTQLSASKPSKVVVEFPGETLTITLGLGDWFEREVKITSSIDPDFCESAILRYRSSRQHFITGWATVKGSRAIILEADIFQPVVGGDAISNEYTGGAPKVTEGSYTVY